jgi:bifunctional DNA-binding transcriptional regulator/antitoxin component of YhaV-PrlF toxin-antitoxin module
MPLQTVKLTSKRQATFPVALCEELGVRPGDDLSLERREVDGAPAWIIRTRVSGGLPGFAALRRFAVGKSRDISDIRRSIGAKLGAAKR